MSRVRTPENIEIAALKRKQQVVFDPMFAGSGTPWEDRATHGTVGAFFKTCMMSLTSPGKLTNSIRRPETNTDAKGFLIGVSAIWAITALIHTAYFIWRETHDVDYIDIDWPNAAVLGAIALVGAGVGVFFLFKIYNAIYGRLTSQEKDSVLLPDVLLYNVNVYALGPSLLALIPLAGPVIALIWIFADLIAVGNKRLRLRMPAAIIDALISLAAVLGIVLAVYVVGKVVVIDKLLGYDAIERQIPISQIK